MIIIDLYICVAFIPNELYQNLHVCGFTKAFMYFIKFRGKSTSVLYTKSVLEMQTDDSRERQREPKGSKGSSCMIYIRFQYSLQKQWLELSIISKGRFLGTHKIFLNLFIIVASSIGLTE